MQHFIDALAPFIYGFIVGFFWYPVWKILKKIWSEAKLASSEWSKTDGKSS